MSNAVVVVGDAMRNFKLKLLLLQALHPSPPPKSKSCCFNKFILSAKLQPASSDCCFASQVSFLSLKEFNLTSVQFLFYKYKGSAKVC